MYLAAEVAAAVGGADAEATLEADTLRLLVPAYRSIDDFDDAGGDEFDNVDAFMLHLQLGGCNDGGSDGGGASSSASHPAGGGGGGVIGGGGGGPSYREQLHAEAQQGLVEVLKRSFDAEALHSAARALGFATEDVRGDADELAQRILGAWEALRLEAESTGRARGPPPPEGPSSAPQSAKEAKEQCAEVRPWLTRAVTQLHQYLMSCNARAGTRIYFTRGGRLLFENIDL